MFPSIVPAAIENSVMAKIGAGILMYRGQPPHIEVLLVHPGGPYFRNKDDGAWTIPKGEPADDEDLLATAQREFGEETGFVCRGPFHELAPIKQKGGKIVHAWACRGDCDPAQVKSNQFSVEWPPRSGRMQAFPEVDRAAFFALDEAKQKIDAAQIELLAQLEKLLL